MSGGALAAVGIGAALGAWMRWGLQLALNRLGQPVPLGTLAANLIGGLLVGAALALFARRPELAHWRPLLVTGFLGGLTTFSTFSAESLLLIERGSFGTAVLHSALHLLGALIATAAGYRLLLVWLR